MVDKTRRDIHLGDFASAMDQVALDPHEPSLSGDGARVDVTLTGQQPVRAAPAMASSPDVARRMSQSWLVPGAFAALILAFAGTVIFLVLQLRELQHALAVLETRSRESVATLENQVVSANTTLKSADGATQRSLNLVAADISRLDAGLVRLTRQFEQGTRELVAADAALRTAATESRTAGTQANAQLEARLDLRYKALADGLEQMASRQKQLADNLTRLERKGDVAQLRAEIALLGASIREAQDEHDKRLKATEQAVASSDAFRRQVNATIDRLNQQVSELYQRR